MLTHIKKFESYSDVSIEENENFYDIIGTNLYNLLNDQIQFLHNNYKSYINIGVLKKLIKTKDVSTENIVKILTKDFEHRINRLKSDNLTYDIIFNEIVSYLYFIHFIILALRLNIDEILKTNANLIGITNKKILYSIFSLNKISSLDTNIKKYVKTLLSIKTNTKEQQIEKLKKLTIKFLNARYKIWIDFFKSEKYKEYQIEKLKTAKKDEQQVESENKIQKVEKIEDKKEKNTVVNNVKDTAKDQSDILDKIQKTTISAAISNSFKDKFKQKHGVDAGANNMKPWVLKMFATAEKLYGKPFIITSGYRSPAYQEELRRRPGIKAAKHSPHVEGAAADISLHKVNKRKLLDALKKAGFNRFGVGKSFIHVDAADRINPNIWVPYARWSYKY